MSYFKKITSFLAAIFILAAPAHADNIQFTPNLRSVDAYEIFDITNQTRATAWTDLKNAGVGRIYLSQAMVSPYDAMRNSRNSLTYMSSSQLDDADSTVDTNGFGVTYIGGYGLAPDACGSSTNPTTIGINAANWEYNNIVKRVLDAGIEIDTFTADGPFRRVVYGSAKGSSCYNGGYNFGVNNTASIVLAYYKQMRNLINSHSTQTFEPEMSVLVNLVNWKVDGVAALSAADVNQPDFLGVMSAFSTAMQNDGGNQLDLVGVQIDWPYNYVLSETASVFKEKIKDMRNAIVAVPRWTSDIAIIVSTEYNLDPTETDTKQDGYEGTLACVWDTNASISRNSLPYFAFKNASGTKLADVDSTCWNNQITEDARYMNEAVLYADNVLDGTWRHSGVPAAEMDTVIFMSWKEMPASTIVTMNRVKRYAILGY